jgi:hypothetical protein
MFSAYIHFCVIGLMILLSDQPKSSVKVLLKASQLKLFQLYVEVSKLELF